MVRLYKQPSDFNSYNEIAEWFTKARSPAKGRPYLAWARVYKVLDTYELRMRYTNDQICVVYPDNTIEFTMCHARARRHACTLVQGLVKFVPFYISNIGVAQYGIVAKEHLSEGNIGPCWRKVDKSDFIRLDHPLKFNLITRECLNPPIPIVPENINSEARREWLRVRKAFVRKVETRAKLGVLDEVAERVREERIRNARLGVVVSKGFTPQFWREPEGLERIYNEMRSDTMSVEFLELLCSTSIRDWWRGVHATQPTSKLVLKNFHRLLANYGPQLRRMFGVYQQEATTNDAT